MNTDEHRFVFGLCAFICVYLWFISTSAPTSQPVDYFALSPEDFAKLKVVDRKIDYEQPDQKLLSAAILFETNRYRVKEKLPPLAHLDRLDEAAMIHVQDMVAKQYLAHEEKGTKTPHPWDRVVAVGLRPQWVAENIATMFGIQYTGGKHAYPLRSWHREGLSYTENGPAIPPHTYRTFARDAVKQWIDSPPHRENIMGAETKYLGSASVPALQVGSGIENEFHKFYCGQVFFTPKEK